MKWHVICHEKKQGSRITGTLAQGGYSMKKLMITAIAMVLATGFGCNKQSPPGGPGASNDDNLGLTTAENAFRLKPPMLESMVKEGETKKITIGVTRGKNFDQDVKLEFSDVPHGIKITPDSNEVKANAKEVGVTIEATKDAALGEHTVKLTGTPARSGEPTATTLKIRITKE
jgi:hypothetical protein